MLPRLMIVDDSLAFRKSLAFCMQDFESLKLVGDFENGLDAFMCLASLRPDIVLVDVFMPGMDGLTLSRLIRQTYPSIEIIAITGSIDERIKMQAFEAGISKLIFKDNFYTDILSVLVSMTE